jgi:hypothetical protein
MNRLAPEIIDFYDCEVTKMIAEKYDYEPMEALRQFVCSQTHAMLENSEMGMTMFGAGAIFDIWEAEKVTGDPRRSVYIREDS